MTPKAYMLMGVCVAIVMLPVAIVLHLGPLAAALFAAGALFGKGYGVWEERTRTAGDER